MALLRDVYGFDGMVMADDLSGMAAVTDRFAPAEAAVQALAAGVDVVLFSDVDVEGLVDVLESATEDGTIAAGAIDAAVARTLAFKGVAPCRVDLG